ncbi:hypothetical protein [Desertivirga brevis]|uniref:hypothetical protein n=1 Tax=Desertivirga brevis TaxID=2810310 RepID=UPI001A97770E|nr:hypothetical protein [Pedobacter sp. SYSU D00873]
MRSRVDYERGVALSEERKRHLLELSERYNFVILEIDDYPDLSYSNDTVPLIARAEKPRVIYAAL